MWLKKKNYISCKNFRIIVNFSSLNVLIIYAYCTIFRTIKFENLIKYIMLKNIEAIAKQ